MSKVIVIEFVHAGGDYADPDGSEGFKHGGWAFRFGPEAVAGDKFKLRKILETGVLLLGPELGSVSLRSGRAELTIPRAK
jgi:hypothetical protein